MSNRLAIDPSEIKISDPAAVRARLWARSPGYAADEAPVVKVVTVDFRSDDEVVTRASTPRPTPRPTGRPRLPKPPGPIRAADMRPLYVLANISPDGLPRPLTQILKGIARVHQVTVGDLTGRDRNKRICDARQHAYYAIAKERPDISYQEIARRFSDRDHSTVVHGAAIFAERNGLPPVVRS